MGVSSYGKLMRDAERDFAGLGSRSQDFLQTLKSVFAEEKFKLIDEGGDEVAFQCPNPYAWVVVDIGIAASGDHLKMNLEVGRRWRVGLDTALPILGIGFIVIAASILLYPPFGLPHLVALFLALGIYMAYSAPRTYRSFRAYDLILENALTLVEKTVQKLGANLTSPQG